MKEQRLYTCDHCSTSYKDKTDCKACENNHVLPKNIHDARFIADKNNKNYPTKIEVEMADGKKIWYHR